MASSRAQCFPNKPRVTPDLSALLLHWRVSQSGDRDEVRRVQRNARVVWRRLKALSGQGKNERRNPELGDGD